jgi:hypothetical protein
MKATLTYPVYKDRASKLCSLNTAMSATSSRLRERNPDLDKRHSPRR